jgi:hypothetical protein
LTKLGAKICQESRLISHDANARIVLRSKFLTQKTVASCTAFVQRHLEGGKASHGKPKGPAPKTQTEAAKLETENLRVNS